MRLALDLFTVVMVSLGCLFILAGTVGLLRFPDTLSRLHALTKADNLGLGLVVLGLLAQTSWPLGALKLIALWLLALLGGAVVAQVLGAAVRPARWQADGVSGTRDEEGT
jgi:multicomponent Na+:H+ antiporter subunit G